MSFASVSRDRKISNKTFTDELLIQALFDDAHGSPDPSPNPSPIPKPNSSPSDILMCFSTKMEFCRSKRLFYAYAAEEAIGTQNRICRTDSAQTIAASRSPVNFR